MIESTLNRITEYRLIGNVYQINLGYGLNVQDTSSFILHDSINIGGNTFFEVKEFQHSSYPNEIYFFLKDSVGLLRTVEFNQNDTVTFDLVNYQVSLFPRIY